MNLENIFYKKKYIPIRNLRYFPTFTSFQIPTNEKPTQYPLKLSNNPLFLLFTFK